jgi:hypothetical protein
MERFNLKKLNEVEQYRVEVSNSIWETIRENIKISAKEILGYYELKKHGHGHGHGWMKDA